MTRRLYVARDVDVTVVSRGRVRMGGARRIDRPWGGLAEWVGTGVDSSTAGQEAPSRSRRVFDSLTNAAFVVLPPVLAGSITAAFAPVEVGFAVGGGILLASSALARPLRQRLTSRGPHPGRHEAYTLTSERHAFQRAVATADRISETWPSLGSLVDAAEAERMLADALWEIAGLLSRRQTLTGVLAELSRPEFAVRPTDALNAKRAPSDELNAEPHATKRALSDELNVEPHATRRALSDELNAGLRATKQALSELDMDLAHREASLRRADQAGRDFIREEQMRRAIKSAEESREAPTSRPDAGTQLADQTRSVLEAYRELTG